MKTDLVTSIIAAIVGAAIAYFVCGLFLPELTSVTFKTLNTRSSSSYSITEPDPEVFNYRAVDPTVEVYVGNESEGNQNGSAH